MKIFYNISLFQNLSKFIIYHSKIMQKSTFYYNQSLIPQILSQKVLQSYNGVTFEEKEIKVVQQNLQITSHRLIFRAKQTHAFVIQGQQITQAEIAQQGILWGKQFLIKVRTKYGDNFKIRLKNYKQAHITITGMVHKKAWTLKQSSQQKGPEMYSGMMKKIGQERDKISKNQSTVSHSFSSFDALFGNLRDLKNVMTDMKSNTNSADGQNPQVNKILKDIGFVSVISKQETGRDYYRHLAQSIFLICESSLFKTYGGMVSLLDVFYFYNKKRQMQLISPQELLRACEQFHKFNFKARLVEYPNNIKMIESSNFDAEKDFKEHFSQQFNSFQQGFSAEEVARKKGLPLVIVDIKLKNAVMKGWLAVDDRIEGVKYFKNLLMNLK